MMTRILMTTMIAGALLLPSAEAKVKNRQLRQGARIHQGVHNGSLTRREARGLGGAWMGLNRSIRRDRRDGGRLTKRERVKIHQQQDRMSRAIYKQKHDAQNRR